MPDHDVPSVDPAGNRVVARAAGTGRRARRRTALAARTLLVALPVVLATACGGAADETGSSGSEGRSSTQEKAAPAAEQVQTWQVTNSDRGQYDYGLGAWLHDDTVVHATTSDVLGVDAATGEESWRFEPPEVDGKPAEFCGASERAVQGKVALAYGVGGEPEPGVRRHCTEVLLLDLATQKMEWTKSFVGGEAEVDSLSLPQQAAYVELVGDTSVETVVAGYLRYLRAFDASGTELWHNRLVPAEGSSSDASCSLGDLTSEGSHLTMLSTCTRAPSSVLWVDPATEEVTRRARLESSAIGGELAAGGILRTGPTVLSVMLENRVFEYLTVNDEGGIDQVIENPESSGSEQIDFSAKSSPDGARSYHRHAFADNLLATVTVGDVASNKLMLYDLETGEQRWKKGLGVGWKFQPISVDRSGVTALAANHDEGVIRVVHATTDEVKPRTVQEVEAPTEMIGPASSAVLLTSDDRLVAADLDNRSSRERAVLFSFELSE